MQMPAMKSNIKERFCGRELHVGMMFYEHASKWVDLTASVLYLLPDSCSLSSAALESVSSQKTFMLVHHGFCKTR